MARLTGVAIAISGQVHDSIEAVPEPEADTVKIKKLLRLLRKELAPVPKSAKLAKRYGLKSCGVGG